MSADRELRELERLAAQGDPDAIARLALARERAGLRGVPIVVPALGEGVTECTLARWLVKPGDRVVRDQVILEVETDKVSVELVADEAGTIAALELGEGTTAQVGAVVGRLLPPPSTHPDVDARHAQLLAAVVAAPHDPAPRAAYGQFLAGSPAAVRPWDLALTAQRGRWVLSGGAPPGSPSCGDPTGWRVERTALDLVPFPFAGGGRALVEGGFVVGVEATATWLVPRWERLLASAPIDRLALSAVDDPAPVLALPRLEQLRHLLLGPGVRPAALEALAASGRLRVPRLHLRGVEPLPCLARIADAVVQAPPRRERWWL